MIIKVNRKTSKADFEKKIQSINPPKFDLKKYSGILDQTIDGLKYQKEIRSEWD